MSSQFEIELSEPTLLHCDCCNGFTVRLTGFVTENGNAMAIYYASYANNHPDNEVAMLISLGEWHDSSNPAKRAAFYCRITPADAYEVMLCDAEDSPWSQVDSIGKLLTRAEALKHPLKATAFAILDQAFAEDMSLKRFLQRVRCGDAAVPLEKSFAAPDEIFALAEHEKHRADKSRSFASLDHKRFFVRCLVPVPVEHYRTWHMGLWLEVAKTDYDQAREVWDDADRYPTLRFAGTLANNVGDELPLVLGMSLKVHTPNANTPPHVEPPATGPLADLMNNTWPKKSFEQYTVARGYL